MFIGVAMKRCGLCMLSRPKSNPTPTISATYNPPVLLDGYLFFFSWTSGWRSAVSRIYVCFIPDEVLAVWWITSSNPLLGFVFGGSMVALHTPVVTCSVPGQLD